MVLLPEILNIHQYWLRTIANIETILSRLAGLPARPAALLLAAGLRVLQEKVHDGHPLVYLA